MLISNINLPKFTHSGHNLAVVASTLLGPVGLRQPQQTSRAREITGDGVAEVVEDVAQVGDVHGQLLGAARVEAGYGGDVGQVGGAAGGRDAAQQEVSW